MDPTVCPMTTTTTTTTTESHAIYVRQHRLRQTLLYLYSQILRKRSIQLITKFYCQNSIFTELEEFHMNYLNHILVKEINYNCNWWYNLLLVFNKSWSSTRVCPLSIIVSNIYKLSAKLVVLIQVYTICRWQYSIDFVCWRKRSGIYINS